MNDKVTEIYNHMFAPEPIPQRVVEVYEFFNLFHSKVTNMAIRPVDLCVIAALAVMGPPAHDHLSPPEAEAPEVGSTTIDEDGIDNWQPPEPNTSITPLPTGIHGNQVLGIDPTETADSVFAETDEEAKTATAAPAQAGGPMDAAPTPDRTRRSLSATKLQKLTLPELRVHSLEMYGYKMPLSRSKTEAIAILKSKKPIVP